ncbi:MAG: caspase family protein [Bacteroidota bacterium]
MNLRFKLFIPLLLLIFAYSSIAQESSVIVEDNFSDNSNEWWVGRSKTGGCEITRGEYLIKYYGEKSWSSNIHAALNPNRDFVIESRISRLSGTDANGFGLTWGKGAKGYYNFIITPKGKFYVRKVEYGKKGKYLIRWKKTNHISQSSITNKLRVQKSGNEILLFINDKYVAKIPYEPFFGDQVGFVVYQKQQIAVDNFIVYGNADSPVITMPVVKAVSPNLEIRQVAINDKQDIENLKSTYGNGNSIIEPGESVEVTAFVQNFGLGIAKNVVAKINLDVDDRNISFPDRYKTFELGDIASGEYKKLTFFFFTSRRYASKDLPFKVSLSEKAGTYKKEQPLGLKINERTKNIVDVNISKLNLKENADMKQIVEIIELADVDKDIPVTNLNGEKTLAVVIGIEDYKYAPIVDNAKRDAQVFYKYALNVFGIPKENIYYLTNREATLGEFNKIFSKDGWLARRAVENETNIIVFYAGHGAPDVKSKSAYLIPFDIDPNYAKTGFSLNHMYASLSGIKAKSAMVFLDACFSGKSRTNEMLLAGTRAVIIKPENSAFSGKNMAVLAASSNDEYSSAYPEKYHGLFTYYLLKILKENAFNLPSMTVNELFEKVQSDVVKRAGYLDKQQTPSLQGNNKGRLLIMQ